MDTISIHATWENLPTLPEMAVVLHRFFPRTNSCLWNNSTYKFLKEAWDTLSCLGLPSMPLFGGTTLSHPVLSHSPLLSLQRDVQITQSEHSDWSRVGTWPGLNQSLNHFLWTQQLGHDEHMTQDKCSDWSEVGPHTTQGWPTIGTLPLGLAIGPGWVHDTSKGKEASFGEWIQLIWRDRCFHLGLLN